MHFCFDERAKSKEGMAAKFDELWRSLTNLTKNHNFGDFMHFDEPLISSSFRVTNCSWVTSYEFHDRKPLTANPFERHAAEYRGGETKFTAEGNQLPHYESIREIMFKVQTRTASLALTSVAWDPETLIQNVLDKKDSKANKQDSKAVRLLPALTEDLYPTRPWLRKQNSVWNGVTAYNSYMQWSERRLTTLI